MEKEFFSVREAANYSSLSARFLYELCQNKEIRFYKIHKRIVIDIKDLNEYIKSNCIEAVDWNEKAKELRDNA